MRIVLVEPDLADSGALRVSLDRAERWQRAGAQVDLFVAEHGPPTGISVPTGIALHRSTTSPERFRRTVAFGLLRLHRLARRADVVVAGREVGTGLLFAAIVARSARRPLAVTVQARPEVALAEVGGNLLRELTRRALTSAHMAVCVSAGLVPAVSAVGLPAARARVVLNGVDVAGVRREAEHTLDMAFPDMPMLVACGRLTRQKGFDVLLHAHALALRAGAPPHRVIILGDGPERAELERATDALRIRDTVSFAGFVPNPHAYIARAALFVLPSRWEGYGLVIAEALSVGTPVVATDCVSGPSEVLEGERFGRLVPSENPVALAEAIKEHLLDPGVLQARATAAAESATARFDPDRAAEEHLELLADLVSARASRRAVSRGSMASCRPVARGGRVRR